MLQGRTLWELIERRVDATPDALMLVDGDMRTLTFAEFLAEAERAAAGLHSAGLRSSQTVSWQLPTWIESLVLSAALSRLGVIQNPISPACRDSELAHITSQVKSELLVVPSVWDGYDYEQLATEVAQANNSFRILIADRALPQGDPAVLDPVAQLEPDEVPVPSWIFFAAPAGSYSGSSQAADKTVGVCHSDATLIAAAKALVQRLGLIARDRNSLVAEVCEIDSLLWLFASLLSGCSNILIDAFHPLDSIEILSRENVTLAGSGAGFHQACVEAQRSTLTPIFGDIRAFLHFGSQHSPELSEQLQSLFEVPVFGGFGLVEVPLMSLADLSDSVSELETTDGKPALGVEVRVLQADQKLLTDGSEGELCVRAPQMMLGYLNATRAGDDFDQDGFFRTGVLGCIDKRGNLCVTGQLAGVPAVSPPQ
ncbi:MAG: AMP-binding protein [Microthrixaceae bacterium]